MASNSISQPHSELDKGPCRESYSVSGMQGAISGLVWDYAPSDSPLLVFLHANGFTAATYRALLSPVSQLAKVVALDLRGHGESTLPADPSGLHDWTLYRDDVLGIYDQLGTNRPLFFAGHSLGAAVSILVAREISTMGLFLVEPVMLPDWLRLCLRVASALGFPNEIDRLARAASRRRRHWPDPKAAFEAYRDRAAFRTWKAPVLDDYVTSGLRSARDGSFELRCEPAWEAATFRAQSRRLWGSLSHIKCPVQIVAGTQGSTFPPTLARMAMNKLPTASLFRSDGASHFLPMECPAETAAKLSNFLQNPRLI